MNQSAELTVVLGDTSPIGAALVQRLLHLGHPRSQILLQSTSVVDWVDSGSVRVFFERAQPELVYLIDSSGCTDPLQRNTARTHGDSATLSPGALLGAARAAGVTRLMYVATAHEHHELQLCAALAAEGLDYRSVRTCQAYGPYSPSPVPARVARAARVIEDLLHTFTSAALQGCEQVVVKADPLQRIDLMYARDVAEAIVHVTDLPRSVLACAGRPWPLHIDIGAEDEVCVDDLIEAVAQAAGFHGRVLLEAVHAASSVPPLGNRQLASLGWRPLIPLPTGMELTAMDFRLRHRMFPTALPRNTATGSRI